MKRIIIELTDKDMEWARYGLLDPDFLADKVKNALAVPEREKGTQEKEITSEFAIAYLLDDCDDCPENENGECLTHSHCFEVKQMAIKALSALKKIRAEIENIPNDDTTKPIGTYDYCMGAENERKLILSIIDKYIGGKE